jgi:hypothetical protein
MHSRAHGEPLARFAIHLLLRKAVERAFSGCTTLKRKRVSPHVVRHGTAMALLQSGVDIAVIALWLKHGASRLQMYNCLRTRESCHEREGARKGRSDRETVPAIPRERSLAGVLGIALTTKGAHSDAPPILHAAHVAQGLAGSGIVSAIAIFQQLPKRIERGYNSAPSVQSPQVVHHQKEGKQMRQIRYVVAMSLDGYIAGPNGPERGKGQNGGRGRVARREGKRFVTNRFLLQSRTVRAQRMEDFLVRLETQIWATWLPVVASAALALGLSWGRGLPACVK